MQFGFLALKEGKIGNLQGIQPKKKRILVIEGAGLFCTFNLPKR